MATAKLRSQCHSTVNCKRYAMFSFTDKFISNRHFRTTALCAVVACMLLLCLHERVAPQGSFSHPADQQWTNSEVPKFFFASASEETQTTDDVPAPENDDLETQTQADQTSQVSSSRRSSRYGPSKNVGTFVTGSAYNEPRSKCGGEELWEPVKPTVSCSLKEQLLLPIANTAEVPDAATRE
nr:hypothetical protein TGBR9_357100 [Toxoplasma gondii TgCATBr9]